MMCLFFSLWFVKVRVGLVSMSCCGSLVMVWLMLCLMLCCRLCGMVLVFSVRVGVVVSVYRVSVSRVW